MHVFCCVCRTAINPVTHVKPHVSIQGTSTEHCDSLSGVCVAHVAMED